MNVENRDPVPPPSCLPPRLIALSPGNLRVPRECLRFLQAARSAFDAGLRGLLLREPLLAERPACELATELAELAEELEDAWFGVHDRVHLALAVGAQAVHLGFRSLPPIEVAATLAGRAVVGFSAHAGQSLEALEGADYAFLGPVLDTPSKRGWVEPLGFEGLAVELRRLRRPTWAIGGLLPEHVERALAGGAAGVCALGGLFGGARAADATRDYLSALG